MHGCILNGRRLLALLGAAALAVAVMPADRALGDIAFGAARDVAVPVDPTAISVLGPGLATDPATGEALPVQRVALLGADPAQAVTVVALGRSGDPVGAPSVGALPAGSQPVAMIAADLNGDGRPEIVVASRGTNVLSVFDVPDTPGPLPPPANFSVGPGEPGPGQVTAADVTGDGRTDLVATRGLGLVPDDGVVVLAGDGAGGFGAPQLVIPIAAMGGYLVGTPLRAGDINGDGRTDLLVGGITQGVKPTLDTTNLLEFAGAGAGSFAPLGSVFEPGLTGLFVREVADMDADGNLDVVFGRGGSAGIRFGDGNGGFSSEVVLPAGPSGAQEGGITVADVDGDGRPDLLIPSPFGASPVLDVRPNLGGRRFAGPVTVPLPAQTDLVASLDLNADGGPDLVLGRGSQPGTIAVLTAAPVLGGSGVYLGEQQVGAATQAKPLEIVNSGVAPARIASVVVGGPAAGDFTIVDDGCGGRVVAGGARCAIGVELRPSAVGRRDGDVTVTAAGGEAVHVTLAGAGLPPKAGPAGAGPIPSARAGCATHPRGGGTRLRCGVVVGPGATVARVAVRLVRGGRVRAVADARSGGRLVLRARRPLTAGRYTLVAVVVAADGRTRQTRREVMIRRPS